MICHTERSRSVTVSLRQAQTDNLIYKFKMELIQNEKNNNRTVHKICKFLKRSSKANQPATPELYAQKKRFKNIDIQTFLNLFCVLPY